MSGVTPPNATPKVLVLSRVLPYPPAAGGDISYSKGLICSIARCANVTAISAAKEIPAGSEIVRDGVTWMITGPEKTGRAGSLVSRLPYIAWRGSTHSYRAAVQAALQQDWDAIVLDNIGVSHCLDSILQYRARRADTKIVYVSHEHEASVRREKYAAYGGSPLQRLAMNLDGSKVTRAEQKLINNVDIISIINPDDERLYSAQADALRFVRMRPGYEGKVVSTRAIDASTPRRVVLFGGRGPKQKQLILERWLESASQVLAAHNIEMVVAGPIDSDFANALKTRFPDTRFPGYVDDIESLFSNCRIGVIADFLGGGFKVRLLSYVFNRVPMFALRGAVSELGLQDARAHEESDDFGALVANICENIDNFDLLNELQTNAFNGCRDRYDWDDRGKEFVRALDTR